MTATTQPIFPPIIDQSVQQAITHREAGRFKDAAQGLHGWLARNPRDAVAYALLAQVLSLDKQDETAWIALNAALAIDPALPIVQRNYARLLLKQQKLDEALHAAQAAYQADVADAENQLVLAAALAAKNQHGQAFSLIESALKKYPHHAEAHASRALLKLRTGDSAGALVDAEKSLRIKPHLTQLWSTVGSLRLQLNDLPGAIEALEKLHAHEPDNVSNLVSLGELKRQAGAVEPAVALLTKAVSIVPDNAPAWVGLGAALQKATRFAEAKAAYEKALALSSEKAEIASNLGALAKEEGNWSEALRYIDLALKYQPNRAAILNNRAVVLMVLGRFAEAEQALRQVIHLEPAHIDAYIALSGMLVGQKRYEDAQAVLDAAMSSDTAGAQRLALAYVALYRAQSRWLEAEACARNVLAINPNSVEALNALTCFLLAQNDRVSALSFIVRSLQIEENNDAKILFVECVKTLRFAQIDEQTRHALTRALTDPWCRPRTIINAVTSVIKLNLPIADCLARAVAAWPRRLNAQGLFGDSGIAACADDALFRALLLSAPICGIDIERFLTMARQTLLDAATNETALPRPDNRALTFYAALAQQCFINEYVFVCNEVELKKLGDLLGALILALEAKKPVPALWLAAVAAYLPLHVIPYAARLLDSSWPDAVAALLVQQVREPESDLQERAGIPHLTSIEDRISLLVQNQYEENPYPRWIKAEPATAKPTSIDRQLRQAFPYAQFQTLEDRTTHDLLIAGCGTGQHSIARAQELQGARILAIDLSMNALCYAKRKSRELGLLGTIEYAQADILKLGSLGRTFDVIESIGALHHLADPLAGWQVLLSLLRPGGFMMLGLYSVLAAQRNINRMRSYIAERGYGSSIEDIRRCRQELMDLDASANFGTTLKSGDFFCTSTCRDLLFHVHEYRLTLAEIEAFVQENQLNFLGFEIDSDMLSAYKRRFPNDKAAIDLAQWQIFEHENPDTFIGMYQFWVQKMG